MSDDAPPPFVHVLPSTAWHQAGHVVAAYFLGRRFDTVTVGVADEEQGSQGTVSRCGFEQFADEFTPHVDTVGAGASDALEHLIRPIIVELYAGHASEKAYMGRSPAVASQHDRDVAARLADYCVGSEDELTAYTRWLYVRAEAAVASPFWQRAIYAVADAFLDRRTLTYDEVRALLEVATRKVTRPTLTALHNPAPAND